MSSHALQSTGENFSIWLVSLTTMAPSDIRDAVPMNQEGGERLRLSVLSPSGRLSAANEGKCEAVLDGWLYNRSELIADLGAPDETADATLAIRAYLRWGEAAIHRLQGVFALCIWDARSRTLLGVRDPVGVYPLFYARAGHDWLFSTSVDTLLHHPSVPKTVHRPALAMYLLREYRDIEETYFSSIRRVPPGHVLKITAEDHRIQVGRYWHPVPSKKVEWVKEPDLEQFPALLKQAIGRCFQLGRAGVYLSGGLDSGTVATLATEYAQEKLLPLPHALSLVYEDPEANEERIQRGIAGNLGIPQTLVRHEQIGKAGDLFSASLQLNCTWPHPLDVALSPIHLLLGEWAREKGCDIVFSGEGGDEWLAVHYRLAADLMRSLDVSGLRRLWRTSKETGRDSCYQTTKRVLGSQGIWPLLQDGFESLSAKMAPGLSKARRQRAAEDKLPDWLAPDPELRQNIYARAEKFREQVPRTFYQRTIMEMILNQPLTVLYKEDNFECSRRTGILMLEPFYDPEVIQFLVRTPPWLRARGGRYKGLLRQFLHRRHPQLGYDRQQKPYATGFVTRKVFEGARRIWPELKGPQALGELGVVRPKFLDAVITEILEKGDVSQFRRVWMTLCAEIWARSRIS